MSSVSTTSAAPSGGRASPFFSGATRRRLLRRNSWALCIYVVFALLVVLEKIVNPTMGAFDVQTLVMLATPLAFAAMAQAAVVLVGGIDLSIGPMMALVNVTAATWLLHADLRQSILYSLVIIAGTSCLGALTGLVISITRVPDIIVTLATSFIWQGAALLVMANPGGGVGSLDYTNLVWGELWTYVPEPLVVLGIVVLVVWVPWYWSRAGLATYALGSDRTAAFLSGVNVTWVRISAYALDGVFVALAGLALTASTSTGDPNSASNYTLNSVAAVVLGGVSLAGGRGGMLGPICAAFVLDIIVIILPYMGVNSNYALVIQGAIVVLVVLFAGLLTLRRRT